MKDIWWEADFWAREERRRPGLCSPMSEKHYKRKKRLSLIADRLQEAILEDVLLIDTQGKVVGANQVSGYDLGDIVFGRPSALLLALTLENKGSQHQSRLSGHIHDKGVLILGGS